MARGGRGSGGTQAPDYSALYDLARNLGPQGNYTQGLIDVQRSENALAAALWKLTAELQTPQGQARLALAPARQIDRAILQAGIASEAERKRAELYRTPGGQALVGQQMQAQSTLRIDQLQAETAA